MVDNDSNFCCSFKGVELTDGVILSFVYGRHTNLRASVENYLDQICGKMIKINGLRIVNLPKKILVD